MILNHLFIKLFWESELRFLGINNNVISNIYLLLLGFWGFGVLGLVGVGGLVGVVVGLGW